MTPLEKNPASLMSGQGLSMIYTMAPLLIIGVIFYFLVLRPDMKRQQSHRDMLAKLKKGDRVLTGGGVFGVVTGVHDKDDLVVVKISELRKEPVTVEVSRPTIVKVIEADGASHG